MDENVFVTESTFDEHEMAINFRDAMEGSHKRESQLSSSVQQPSRPESYLKAVLDHQPSPDGSSARTKTNSDSSGSKRGFNGNDNYSYNNDLDDNNDDEASDNSCDSSNYRNHRSDHGEGKSSSSRVGGLSCTESIVDVEGDGEDQHHHHLSVILGGAAANPELSPGNSNISAFNQVICQLKDDCGRHLKKTPVGRTHSNDSQTSVNDSSPFVTILNGNADVEANVDNSLNGCASDIRTNNSNSNDNNHEHSRMNNNNDGNSNNPFVSAAKSENESARKRNESLNSPFQITPAYSEFRNGLKHIPDSMELTDL